ncbi:hypothetical protein [Pedobacter africanus]|jgi:hypothetical protein|uniref:Uncharacterized protein n=1 Tax=Pedobacter africanus TaxID=151894 RepID=A0A1W2DDR9_9SPHI|nr:hypothetical protein [Pedobacter africanus]SMC95553.1 hypothetical protein SAMN04488524_3668 [Pedobacter africanus]
MENQELRHTEDPNKPHKPIEHDYAHHQDDPGPSPQAVKEKDINGAAIVLRWLIPLLVIALLIYWFVYKGAHS